MRLTFSLLAAAMCSVWLPDLRVGPLRPVALWQVCFVAAVASGLLNGQLSWLAPIPLFALWLAAAMTSRPSNALVEGLWGAVAVLLALALALHWVGGFQNPVVANHVSISDNSAPMTLRLNFDKGAAGLIFLAYFCRRSKALAEAPSVFLVGTAIGAVTAVAVLALASSTGFIHVDPKLPELALVWMPANLLLTCLPEEVFFRGVIQDRLQRHFAQQPRWRWVPITFASALFGVAHIGSEPWVALAATLSGFGYGFAYARTHRVEAAVLAHFTVNAIHFFGFTYPYAAR